MAFPQSVLPLRVRIAPGGNPAADPSTWSWIDITSDVRIASGMTISAGQADEGTKVDPGKCTLTLDNTSGNYSIRNVLGAYYGQLAKGTPLRAGVVAVGDAFNRTRASGFGTTDTGQSWVHSSTSSWSVNGTVGQYSVTAANIADFAIANVANGAKLVDCDAQFTVSVPAVMTGATTMAAFVFRYVDTANYLWASCEFNTGGTVTAKFRATLSGTAHELATTGNIAGLSYTANQKLRVRVLVDGVTAWVKIWVDGTAQPVAWNLSIDIGGFMTPGPVGFYLWCLAGNTNTKPFAVSLDDLEVEKVEFTGNVYEWPPRWDQSRKDATVPITASGILRRLQQGKSPLRSAITRMMLRQNGLLELIPFEDGSQATVAASALPGGATATVRAVEFGQTDAPILPGAEQTMGITASTVVSYRIRPHTATGTWAVVWFAQLLAPPAADTMIMSVTASGTVRRWDVILGATAVVLNGYDATGTQIYTSSALYGSNAEPPLWIAFDLLVKQVSGNIDARLLMYGVDPDNLGSAVFFGTTVAGTVGSPTGGTFQGSLGFNQGRMGALAAFNTEPLFVDASFTIAANGYIGESASDRIERLCDEEGVQLVLEAGTSELLGAQRTDTFLNLLYSASDADMGILYERGAGLAYRPRGARYNRAVELALDFAVGDIADPPEPTDDDQQLKNQWTVTRDSSSSATASNQASIDASGLLDDSVTINVATDDVLPDQASWRLATTTVDELRWPSITLDMARNTGQISLWRTIQPFPRMTIANEPSQVAGVDVDLTVLGYTQTLTLFGWDVELNCQPSPPWSDAGVYGTTRYDSQTSTLVTGVNATATSWSVTAAAFGDTWSSATPYDLLVSGEQITLTNATAPAGTGPYTQTLTVTRSVNGIAKTHLAGESIRIATPGRYAL